MSELEKKMVVIDNEEEVSHVLDVLARMQRALEQSDSFTLHQLSDQILHTASIHQHTDILTVAVIAYSLHRIVTKRERIPSKEWNTFTKKCNLELKKASDALKEKDIEEFARHLSHAKELLETSTGKGIGIYAQEALKKASVNKATKVYEHGISLSRTAKLLGLSQWELLEYVGQRESRDSPFVATIDEKKRAAQTLAFFS